MARSSNGLLTRWIPSSPCCRSRAPRGARSMPPLDTIRMLAPGPGPSSEWKFSRRSAPAWIESQQSWPEWLWMGVRGLRLPAQRDELEQLVAIDEIARVAPLGEVQVREQRLRIEQHVLQPVAD